MTNLITDPAITPVLHPPLKYIVFMSGISAGVKTIIASLYATPELQQLANLTENNAWHDHENELSHVETVFANLQLLNRLEWVVDPVVKRQSLEYLHAPPGRLHQFTRQELLLIACALHDVGKGATRPPDDPLAPGNQYLLSLPDGTTLGTGHEAASALLAPQLLAPFKLAPADRERIVYLVAQHDKYSLSWCEEHISTAPKHNLEADAQVLRDRDPDHALELNLHMWADGYGAEPPQVMHEYLMSQVAARYFLV